MFTFWPGSTTLNNSRVFFAGYFASNLAREVARLTGWTDKIWSRRYQAIVISHEEKAQAEPLEYILSHGV